MQSEIRTLKNIFDNNNIPVSIEWLEECSTWCKKEILNANYTIDKLKNAIHDQWLLLDLRDTESSVLPTGLSEKKYMVLDGNFSLQVMQVIDISKPKYWQLQQIRKENVLTRPTRSETNDSVGTGKRVLQLTLTDGVQCVEAMEYKPISLLSINLTPGIKVRLSGPITIRRGRLMLEEQNIRILGGEVEDLLIPNAAENILARALNVSENPNPQVVDVNLLTVDQEDGNIQTSISAQQGPSISINLQNNSESTRSGISQNNYSRENMSIAATNNIQNRNSDGTAIASTIKIEDYPTDEDLEMFMQAENLLEITENKCSERKVQISNIDTSSSNKLLDPYDEEIEMLMEVENELENNLINEKRNNINKTPELFEDDLNPDHIDQLIEMTEKIEDKILPDDIRKKSIQIESSDFTKSSNIRHPFHNEPPSTSISQAKNSKANLCDDFINEEHLFSNLDFDDLESPKEPENTSDVISITKLLQHLQQFSIGSFKIRAKYKSVVEKLTLQQGEYKLTIMVQDESNEVVCRVHSDVVAKWAGLTPTEIINLKKNIFSQDIESKKKVETALQNLKGQLVAVNHVMEIQINGKDSSPIIKNIFY